MQEQSQQCNYCDCYCLMNTAHLARGFWIGASWNETGKRLTAGAAGRSFGRPCLPDFMENASALSRTGGHSIVNGCHTQTPTRFTDKNKKPTPSPAWFHGFLPLALGPGFVYENQVIHVAIYQVLHDLHHTSLLSLSIDCMDYSRFFPKLQPQFVVELPKADLLFCEFLQFPPRRPRRSRPPPGAIRSFPYFPLAIVRPVVL